MSHYKPYPEYNASGADWVTELPAGWRAIRTRFLFKNNRQRRTEADEQLSATQKYGVIPQRMFMESEEKRVMLADTGIEHFKHVDVDDFVISLRSFEGGIERCFYSGCISPAYTAMKALRPVSPDFFQYLLKSDGFIKKMQIGVYGIRDGKAVSFEDIADIHLPLPSLDAQYRIAAELERETSRIDSLISRKTRFIKLLKEKRQALITRAVTKGLDPNAKMKDSGVTWIGSIPENWGVAPLKRFWDVIDCKHLTADFVQSGFPLASIREVQSRYVSLENAKRTTEQFYLQLIEGGRKPAHGDLIFSRNATVGQVAQVSAAQPPFAMGQDVCLLRKKSPTSSTDFTQYLLYSDVVARQLDLLMVGATFKRVNVEEIRNLLVPAPPPGDQTEIGDVLLAHEQRFAALEEKVLLSIDLLRERRSALITAGVTGHIDLRDAA